jgi:hypothetical protein
VIAVLERLKTGCVNLYHAQNCPSLPSLIAVVHTTANQRLINVLPLVNDNRHFAIEVDVKKPVRLVVEIYVHSVILDLLGCKDQSGSLGKKKKSL